LFYTPEEASQVAYPPWIFNVSGHYKKDEPGQYFPLQICDRQSIQDLLPTPAVQGIYSEVEIGNNVHGFYAASKHLVSARW
jgi:hypothetical protein